MKITLFFAVFLLSLVTLADSHANESQEPRLGAEFVNPNLTEGHLTPFADTGHIREKIESLGDLTEQERFLQSLGFEDDWPTPAEVDERIREISEEEPTKLRGLANIPVEKQAELYREVYEGPWGNADPHMKSEGPHTEHRSMASTCLDCETKYTAPQGAGPSTPPSAPGQEKSE